MNTHKHMTNTEIANLLRLMAAVFEAKNEDPGVKGTNKFRIRAYENAADSIEHASSSIRELWEKKQLSSIPGVGPTLQSHLDELFKTGKVTHFEREAKGLPKGMFALLGVQGFGPKTAYKLSQQFKLTNEQTAIQELIKIAQEGKISQLEGFGKKSEQDILQNLQSYTPSDARISLATATMLADKIVDYLKKHPATIRVHTLGSLRRRMATVGDIDLAVSTLKGSDIIKHFVTFPEIKEILAQGPTTARFIHPSGMQVDIKTQTPSKYGALLQHFTGSKNHNVHLREIALEHNVSLSEHGIKRNGKIIEYPTEKSFYKAINMTWIPPELREDSGEIEAALRQAQGKPNGLPQLVELKDIKGDLHTHTSYDWVSSHDQGKDSMERIVETAISLGYEYIAVGDHNPSVSTYSNQKIISEISRRSSIIEHIKTKGTINILKTLEVDIKTDGSLAIPNAALQYLDFVVVSVHSAMKLPKSEMTSRVLEALSHPKAKILGHPTGRLLGQRAGYELDWETVFDFCIKQNKFLEINAQPSRLDLPDTIVREAIGNGVKLIISTDSHSAENLELMRYGIDVARRGWATRANIVNSLPWKEFNDTMKA